jgi:hypothetical protein
MKSDESTTGKTWDELTPKQKRAERIQLFMSPPGMKFINPEARNLYTQRARRLVDVYNLKEPDRVPLALHFGSLPLQHFGLDYYSAAYDFPKAIEIYNRFNEEFASDLDSFANVGMIVPGKAFETLDYKLYSWPGHGLPKNATGYQFQEGEYMKPEEYDDLIINPADFWMRFYLPRIFGAMECFSHLDPITELVEIPTGQLMPLATAPVQAMLQSLLKAGKELQERASLSNSLSLQGTACGFPPMVNYLGIAPFDIIGDTLRGTRGIMLDMYRRPDKLLEALDVITRIQVRNTIKRAAATKGLVVTFPLHKGADGWLSEKQFEKFYWPTLKQTIDALVNEGLIVYLFAEGSYDTRLESVNEFPKGAIHWWFDKTDMARAKKILGNKCSLSGNVPASLLMTGSTQEVKEYCHNLINVCGQGGGYILSEGAADTEAKVENLMAMAQAAREYGVYKK